MSARLLVTGDKHSLAHVRDLSRFKFAGDDVLIVTGDTSMFINGGYTRELVLKNNGRAISAYERLGCTILFVAGNHDNVSALEKLEVVDRFGSQVRKVSDRIYQMINGNVYEIQGKKVLAFGGAATVLTKQNQRRLEPFKNTVPTSSDFDRAHKNLVRNNYRVDLVITHDCPTSVAQLMHNAGKVPGDLTKSYLDDISYNVEYDEWVFGHHHMDAKITARHRCVLNNVVEIGVTEKVIAV